LIAKNEVANDTWAFIFERPADYQFLPGQYLQLRLDQDLTDTNPNDYIHTFSIASGKNENVIQIVTRIRASLFKQKLYNLNIGQEVIITEAKGKLTVEGKEDVKNIIFLVGGIGITPVLSIVNSPHVLDSEEIDDENKQNVLVLWSNFDRITTPYYQTTLEKFGKVGFNDGNRKIRFMYTFTGELSQSEDFYSGRINEATLNNAFIRTFGKKFVERQWGVRASTLFYLVGSSKFVKGMESLLIDNGVPNDFLIKEVFGGY
jgi:ferredoxin-NADP reductase